MQIATRRAQITTRRAYQIMKNAPVRAETAAAAAAETAAQQTTAPATAAQQQKQQQEIRKHTQACK